MLPVLQAEVFCDGVEDVHLVPQLGLRVDVSHPEAAGVLRYVAYLNLNEAEVLTAGRPSHSVMTLKVLGPLTVMNLQVVNLQPVEANVAAEGVIDSYHRPVHLIQMLSESAQLPGGLPGTDSLVIC